MSASASDVINFWFDEIEPAQRWKKDPEFDSLVRDRFGETHARAARGELQLWREQAPGALAEVIVLDQFSRNMFRDTPEAFAYDTLALVLAQEAIRRGLDEELSTGQKSFLYMPYMHSESAAIHEVAVTIFSKPGLEDTLNFELKHKAIIDRFGRFPHRNRILGRESTPNEVAFLMEPGSSF